MSQTENINLGKAEATVEADLHTIRAKISESLGETAFNEALQYRLMATLALCVIHARKTSILNVNEEGEQKMVSKKMPTVSTAGQGGSTEVVGMHGLQRPDDGVNVDKNENGLVVLDVS